MSTGGSPVLDANAIYIPGMKRVSDEIAQLSELENDWDEEGASAVDPDCIVRAQTFLHQIVCDEFDMSPAPILPSVYAAVDGGVQLYWFTKWGQTALTFRPGQQTVDVQQKERNSPASSHAVSVEEAVQIALRAMCDA
jgi:hypothetical protein